MDTVYLIVISLLAAGSLVLLVWLKPDLAKKYWGYLIAGVAALAGLIVLVSQRKQKPTTPDAVTQKKEEQLRVDLGKVHAEAEAEIAVARTAEVAVQQEVEEITDIQSEEERLKRLSDLFNRTRRKR